MKLGELLGKKLKRECFELSDGLQIRGKELREKKAGLQQLTDALSKLFVRQAKDERDWWRSVAREANMPDDAEDVNYTHDSGIIKWEAGP